MSLRGDDAILWGGGSRLDAGDLLWRLDRPDAKDAVFLRALVRWCGVAGVDSGVAGAMWLVETGNGTSSRWNEDLNPGGVGIPADSTVQPFAIGDGDEAARILVQCLFAAVRGVLSPAVPVPAGARGWFEGVWLAKVAGDRFPRPAMLRDLNVRYVDGNGEWQAVWAWDAGYVEALIARAGVWLPGLGDQVFGGGAGMGLPGVPGVERPRFFDLATDYARFGLSFAGSRAVLDSKFPGRNGGRPRAIVLHIQDGVTTGSLEYWVGRDASSTVMVQRDGSVLRVIPEGDGPWTNGDVNAPLAAAYGLIGLGGNVNNWSLTIEAEGFPAQALTGEQVGAIVWVVEDWLIRYPEIGANWQANLLSHYMINSVDKARCGLYRPVIVSAVAAWAAGPVIVEPPVPPVAPPMYPRGMTVELARRLYGSVRVPWSSKVFGFDPGRPECQAWLVWGKAQLKEGEEYSRAVWPEIRDVIRRGAGHNVHVYVYGNGRVYERVMRRE